MDSALVQKIALETCRRDADALINAWLGLYVGELTEQEFLARGWSKYGENRDRVVKIEALEASGVVIAESGLPGRSEMDDHGTPV